MAFKPKIVPCLYEEDGESFVFYVRKPNAKEMSALVQDYKEREKKGVEPSYLENLRATAQNFCVHGDGGKLTEAELAEFEEMSYTASQGITDIIMRTVGLAKREADAGKA